LKQRKDEAVAIDAHLKELKQGVKHWNAWRKRRFSEQPDLSGADLSSLNLQGANLIGANLSRCNLSSVNLSGAYLSCANLSGAYLTETNLSQANFSKADLTKADLSFANATRTIFIEANLSRTTAIETVFTEANLSFTDLNRANFTSADFQDANLTRANLIEANCTYSNFRGCNLSQAIASESSFREANLIEARLSKADFSFANLIEANLRRSNLSQVILIEAKLRGANLREALLRKSNFCRASLGGADLTEVDATAASFAGSDLIRAILSRATFIQAELHDAKLTGATLHKTILAQANLSDSDLSETDLSKADFRQATLTHSDLSRSKIAGTQFSGALLTGICLEDTQLSSTAKLENAICDYVHLSRNHQNRRPVGGQFVQGEFAQFFYNALETINLTLHAGVNWTALAYSLNRLNHEIPTANLGIQCIENKGDGVILLKLSTSPGSDTVTIHRELMRFYDQAQQELEHRRSLSTRETLLAKSSPRERHPRESINRLFELLNAVPAMAGLPMAVDQTLPPETQTPHQTTHPDIATTLRLMLEGLAQRYPDATEPQRIVVTALEIQQRAKQDDSFKVRLQEASRSGSLLLTQILDNNPFLTISFEMVQEWLNEAKTPIQNVPLSSKVPSSVT
jgi:uncharacterized protein YjbI with pentapeptide repeats